MDYYEMSMPCGHCGKRLILTATEVEYHFRHCPLLPSLGASIIDDENAIRTYGGDIGYVAAVYCGGHGFGRGGVMMISADATVADVAETEAMAVLLDGVTDGRIARGNILDAEGTDELMLPPFDENSRFSEFFGRTRMIAMRVRGVEHPCYFKRVLTVRMTGGWPCDAIVVAAGEGVFNDFFSMGYFFDQFCNDREAQKAVEMTDYLNGLMRFAAPDIFMNMRSVEGGLGAVRPAGLDNNCMDSSATAEFRKFMRKERNCDTCTATDVFRNITADQLRQTMTLYGFRRAGMKKQDMVEFFAQGRHVEKGITDMINVYEYDRLQELMEYDGFMPVPEGQLDSAFVSLFQLGLAFCGRTGDEMLTVFIPREFLFLYRRLLNDERVVSMYEHKVTLEKRLNGLMYAYGVLPVKKLFTIYKKVFREAPLPDREDGGEQKEWLDFRTYIRREYAHWPQKTSVGRLFMSEKEDFVFHENYWFPAGIQRRGLPKRLRPVTPEEVEAHGTREDEDYVTAFDSICSDIWDMLNLSDDDSSNIYTYMYNLMLFGLMQGGTPENVFELLTRKMPVPFEHVKYILDILKAEVPYVRQWMWGGYSAEEIMEMEEKKRPRIKMSFQNEKK